MEYAALKEKGKESSSEDLREALMPVMEMRWGRGRGPFPIPKSTCSDSQVRERAMLEAPSPLQ